MSYKEREMWLINLEVKKMIINNKWKSLENKMKNQFKRMNV